MDNSQVFVYVSKYVREGSGCKFRFHFRNKFVKTFGISVLSSVLHLYPAVELLLQGTYGLHSYYL